MDFQQQESQQPSSISDISLEEMIELLATKTYRFHQETQASIRSMADQVQLLTSGMADQVHLLTSKIMRLASYLKELPSQTNINLEKDESAIIRPNDMELQESQENESKDAVEKEVDVQKMSLQYQPVQVNESSEQPPNAVTSPPFLNQYSPDSYSSIPVNEIDFIIPENFEFHDSNKLRVAMARYLEPINASEGGVNGECKLSLTCLAPFISPWKPVIRVPKDYSIYESYQDYIEDETLRRVTRFYPP